VLFDFRCFPSCQRLAGGSPEIQAALIVSVILASKLWLGVRKGVGKSLRRADRYIFGKILLWRLFPPNDIEGVVSRVPARKSEGKTAQGCCFLKWVVCFVSCVAWLKPNIRK
jgi:hypothetical protein